MTPVRRRLALAVGAAVSLLASPAVRAGAQREESLADPVRNVLSSQIADAAPRDLTFGSYAERIAYLNWLGEMSNRLKRRQDDFQVRQELLQSVWYEARRAGLPTDLVLGLMEVGSGFRKHVVSVAGARGLMQVMPFWTRQIGNGDPRTLFDLRTNLRYGCTILRYYLDRESGDLYFALGRYNGSRGRPEYPNAVLSASRRWQMPAVAGAAPAPAPVTPGGPRSSVPIVIPAPPVR
ncbi:lytic transglycosylase domain-containing protein [soil metagenome]